MTRPSAVDLMPLIKRFRPAVPEVAVAIADEIFRDIPGYSANPDPAVRAEVTGAVERNVEAFLRALSEGRDLPKRDIEELAEVGKDRAHQGVPIEDVLRAFRTVGRVLWDHLATELTGPEGPSMEVAIELSGTLMRFTDQISSAVAHHYSVAQRAIVRQQEAARREFLHDLLQGTYANPDDMIHRARSFGYDLARDYLAVVARASGPESDLGADETAVAKALDRVSEEVRTSGQPIVDRRAGQTVGMLALAPGTAPALGRVGAAVLSHLGDHWSLGIGGPYSGLEGIRRSYLEAREALEIGSTLDPNRRVYPFEDFILYRFLRADPGLVSRFVDAVIGEIVRHDDRRRSELVKTLEAYFAADGSAKEAGKRLFAHPHTVTYRLKQIEKLTGRSLRDPEDKLHLHLAIKALRLAGDPHPGTSAVGVARSGSEG